MAKFSVPGFKKSASTATLASGCSSDDTGSSSTTSSTARLAHRTTPRSKRFFSLGKMSLNTLSHHSILTASERDGPPGPPPNTPQPNNPQSPKLAVVSLLRRATAASNGRRPRRSASFSTTTQTTRSGPFHHMPSTTLDNTISSHSPSSEAPLADGSGTADPETPSMKGLQPVGEPVDGSVIVLVPASIEENPSVGSLPTPPIILSAPTPPHPVRLSTSESFMVHHGGYPKAIPSAVIPGAYSQNAFALEETRGDIFAIAHTLQHAARQVEADPNYNQATLFRSMSPIVAFLYALVVGVLLPRHLTGATDNSYGFQRGYLTTVVVLGLLATLTTTRALVWVASTIGQSFCALDVDQALKTGECVDSHGERFTQADVLVGGLLGH